MRKKLKKSKKEWAKAVGAFQKARRLHLRINTTQGAYFCPVKVCDHDGFLSVRGCRKHVFSRHGWYYYFDEKPAVEDAFPEDATSIINNSLPAKPNTKEMPSFCKSSTFANTFQAWLRSEVGGGKSKAHSSQICVRLLKYLRFCCPDADVDWELTMPIIDHCLGSIHFAERFVNELKEKWQLGHPGIIAYLDSISQALDYRRLGGAASNTVRMFSLIEIFISRVRKYANRKMRLQWNTVLAVERYEEVGCWSTVEELKAVIPFHETRYSRIISDMKQKHEVPPSDLSFATSFVATLLFLDVKAARPMTYQYLTVDMIYSIKEEGYLDQTIFKTNETYGFDSLYFDKAVLAKIKDYVTLVRPALNPTCQYLLITKNGKQHSQLCYLFFRIFMAIGKYIHPTRYRQVIETESAANLTREEQNIVSADQKHSSNVAKVHYKKLRSRDVCSKSRELLKSMKHKTNVEVPHDDAIEIKDEGQEGNSVQQEEDGSSSTEGVEVCISSSSTKQRKRFKKTPFTLQEDLSLKKGIKKYGVGKWTNILRDPDYDFQASRKASSLVVRAKHLNLMKIQND